MGELGRRVVHASGVVLPSLYLVELFSWNELRVLLVLGSAIALGLEVARLRVGLDWWIYRNLTRPYETDTIAGYALYMFSITGVALVTRPEIAIPAMLMLMIGDPISGYLGSGEPTRLKSPASLAAMFLVSMLVALPFALDTLETTGFALAGALVAATLATLADGITWRIRGRIVDDNLTIPVAGAAGLWASYALVSAFIG